MIVAQSVEDLSKLRYLATPGIEIILAHAKVFEWDVFNIIAACKLVNSSDVDVFEAMETIDQELVLRENFGRF